MIKLVIEHSTEREVARVERLVSRIGWYEENGYAITLPDGVVAGSSESEIRAAVDREYSSSAYEAYAEKARASWEEFLPRLSEVRETLPFQLRDDYTLALTRYGTGGSYDTASGTIVINIVTRPADRMLGTLVHEAIHMAVQPLIDTYAVSHWHKERLVDLMGEKHFPGLRKMQIIKEDVGAVDTAFTNFYPDIEKICSVI